MKRGKSEGGRPMRDNGLWGRMKEGKSEGEMNRERLWTLRNKLRVLEGRGWGDGLAW